MSAHSVTVDLSNFEQVVTEGSKRVPVLVDFWAPWCAPCRALTPVLEKLAVEYQGRFVLAKINSDENQKLAAQFGVRGIPNVKAFVDGGIRDDAARKTMLLIFSVLSAQEGNADLVGKYRKLLASAMH